MIRKKKVIMPDDLAARIEKDAEEEGISVNEWMVRAVEKRLLFSKYKVELIDADQPGFGTFMGYNKDGEPIRYKTPLGRKFDNLQTTGRALTDFIFEFLLYPREEEPDKKVVFDPWCYYAKLEQQTTEDMITLLNTGKEIERKLPFKMTHHYNRRKRELILPVQKNEHWDDREIETEKTLSDVLACNKETYGIHQKLRETIRKCLIDLKPAKEPKVVESLPLEDQLKYLVELNERDRGLLEGMLKRIDNIDENIRAFESILRDLNNH